MYIEGLKRLHFDSNNDVIYPLENLQMENVSGVINEWMEKQTFVKILLQKELLKIEDLSFSYPNKQKVLDNVNFSLYKGK